MTSRPSAGAVINYGTHAGTHVRYVNVTEDSGADEPLPLFGPPTVTGNSIDFNPVGFDSTSSGVGSDQTAPNLVYMVTANLGTRIRSMTLNETGTVTLSGNVAPGSMGTAAAVFASGTLDIQEVDFGGINHISVPFSMTFNPSGGTYFLGTDGGGGPIFNTQWSGSVTLDVEAILIANNVPFTHGATKVSIDLVNTLTSTTQTGTEATITKTDFGGQVVRLNVDNDVPEPATLSLLVIAAAIAFARPRRPSGMIGR
jgi:hypothetical protein